MRFGPSIRHNPLGELKELTQTGTIEDYQAKFLAILCRADNLQPRQQVQLFTPGLREPIRTDIELQNPASLQMAMALARAYERRAQVTGQAVMPQPTQPATTPVKAFTTTNTAQPALPIVPTLKPGMRSEQPRRTMRRRYLTSEEMEQRRTTGLCYNFEEKFTPTHCCKRIFLLLSPSGSYDSDTGQDTEEDLEEPGIPLYALIGIKPRTTPYHAAPGDSGHDVAFGTS